MYSFNAQLCPTKSLTFILVMCLQVNTVSQETCEELNSYLVHKEVPYKHQTDALPPKLNFENSRNKITSFVDIS